MQRSQMFLKKYSQHSYNVHYKYILYCSQGQRKYKMPFYMFSSIVRQYVNNFINKILMLFSLIDVRRCRIYFHIEKQDIINM